MQCKSSNSSDSLCFDLDNSLSCTNDMHQEGVLSGDICGLSLQAENINFSCNFKFRSNMAIPFMWVQYGITNVTRDVSCETVTTSLASCSVMIPVTRELHQSQFTFHATSNESLMRRSVDISWTSPSINVLCKF